MAKKPSTPRQQATHPRERARLLRWHQNKKVLLGGGILVLVIALGAFLRYRQQSQIAPRLQGATDNHYARGTAGAPVVIKEFSDYG
jgi:hypothetical protein